MHEGLSSPGVFPKDQAYGAGKPMEDWLSSLPSELIDLSARSSSATSQILRYALRWKGRNALRRSRIFIARRHDWTYETTTEKHKHGSAISLSDTRSGTRSRKALTETAIILASLCWLKSRRSQLCMAPQSQTSNRTSETRSRKALIEMVVVLASQTQKLLWY